MARSKTHSKNEEEEISSSFEVVNTKILETVVLGENI